MDMKFRYWFRPTATPAVGMMPVSCEAFPMVLTICLEMPGRHTGEPEYLLATTPLGTATVLASDRSWLRNSALYRHCLPGIPQYPLVSPKAINTWLLAGSPLSHMIPRSVPVMANRLMVSLGLSGPVTHPTSEVPGGPDGTAAAAGAGAGCAATGGCWVAAPPGRGDGTTAACCCTGAAGGVSALSSAGSRPSLGSGAASFAPTGLCPIGRLNGEMPDGLGIWNAWPGSGW